MIKFNISASSINLYLNNQLEFYYSHILKAEKDTDTPDVYGIAGSLVHSILENIVEKKYANNDEALEDFKKQWVEKDLHNKPGMFNKKLDISKYLVAVMNGILLLETKYKPISSEEFIDFPLVDNDNAKINVKGYIDLVCEDNNQIYIVDWKTSSSIDAGDDFKRQGLMYFFLYYLKHNVLPSKITFEYVKINKRKEFVFTLEEIKEFAKFIDSLIHEILDKGEDVNNYEVGKLTSPFNPHAKKCVEQLEKRNGKKISAIIKNNRIVFFDTLPEILHKMVDMKYSYTTSQCITLKNKDKKYIQNVTYLFLNNSLPLAFKKSFDELLECYNKITQSKVFVEYLDERNRTVVDNVFDTEFKKLDINLRNYQTEAIKIAKDKKLGILALGTGAGKTIIASEIIRRLNRITLLVVNRIELVRQTKQVFEDNLGVEIGDISEGKIDVKQINIASIQSLVAIMKRNNEESKELKKLLYNVSLVIYDECQNVADSKMYSFLNNYLSNIEYCFGLTGTPWRNDGTTLDMNSFVGFPIYTKTTEELENEGYLCKTKCIFIQNTLYYDGVDDYSIQYKKCISENAERNDKIKRIAEVLKDKKILIITKQVKHAKDLNELIPGSEVIVGSTDSDDRKQIFKDFKNSSGILIGSLKIFSAGIDIPDLDVIINASAHKSSVDSIQLIGRLKRTHKDKLNGYYIDFDDSEIFFKNSSNERKKILKNFGNEMLTERLNIEDFIQNRNIYILE